MLRGHTVETAWTVPQDAVHVLRFSGALWQQGEGAVGQREP